MSKRVKFKGTYVLKYKRRGNDEIEVLATSPKRKNLKEESKRDAEARGETWDFSRYTIDVIALV